MSKDKFTEIFETHIQREGAAGLLSYIERSDFFSAPASTRYHSCYEGGLCDHSVNVYERLRNLSPDTPPETLAVCGLLHDLCKVGFYKQERRSRKTGRTLPNGRPEWEDYMAYVVEDKLPYGHGEKSVFIIERFMRLTTEEAMAIRWHMGGFDENKHCAAAFSMYPLAMQLHVADLQATYIDEK